MLELNLLDCKLPGGLRMTLNYVEKSSYYIGLKGI